MQASTDAIASPPRIQPTQSMANRGYAVVQINPRGSTGYGQEFADGTLRDWGGGDYRDLMLGVDAVIERNSWVDPDRLGEGAVTVGIAGDQPAEARQQLERVGVVETIENRQGLKIGAIEEVGP